MRSLILLLIIPVYILVGCKKNKKADTEPVIQGNYISFKLNGQLWESGDLIGGIWHNDVNDFRYIYLFCYRNSESIHLYLNRPLVTGTKLLNEWTMEHYYEYSKNYGAFSRYISGVSNDTWMTDAEDTGYCTITYIDSTQNIIKGDFSFKARNERTGELITISDGHFEKLIR